MKILLLLALLQAPGDTEFRFELDRIRIAQDVPGISAVVIRDGQVVFAGGSGVADIATGRTMTADTVLYMGSLTKVLTAVLTLNLVESGQLSLDEAVYDIGDSGNITVKQLLTHASGLNREGDFGYWFSADFPTHSELAQFLETTDLRSQPGAEMHYSNIGYATLGLVTEDATGKPFEESLRRKVLEPLGMLSSGAHGPAADIANGYSPPGRLIPNASRPFAGVGENIGDRHVRVYHDARAMAPAFGAYSSANDLGRLAMFLLGNGEDSVLSTEMRARMHEKQDSGWGLGLRIQQFRGTVISRHDGWFAAHRSHLMLDVGNGIAVVVMTNGDNAAPGRIADALYEIARR